VLNIKPPPFLAKRKRALAGLAALLLIPGTSTRAQLGPPRINDCNEYLAKTMAQIEMSCYREGQRPIPEGRWYPYLSRHQDWCPGATPEARGIEVSAREVEQGNPETCRGFRQYASLFLGSTPGKMPSLRVAILYSGSPRRSIGKFHTRLSFFGGEMGPQCRNAS
jgi:hypothetical protein